MTPITEAAVRAAARALYCCEMKRAALTSVVMSKVAGKPIADIVEPFEAHIDSWMDDARAALEAAAAVALDRDERAMRCTICGFIVDTRYAAGKPSGGFSTVGRPMKAAAPLIAPPDGAVEAAVLALTSVVDWSKVRCPCKDETPDPCPLCGASVAEGVCKPGTRLPDRLQDKIEAALRLARSASPKPGSGV